MGRYDSHKHPFSYRMNQWSQKRTNSAQEKQTKSIPCHVTKVDKDFITVAFETQNGIFTPPTVKIPQSMSPYGRDPTQVGDKGFASPSDYYLGGVTGDAGGNTSFYPRGNLTAMSFQPVSHKQNPDRDVDQLTHMGGPKGWIVGPHKKQQEDQQQSQTNGQSTGIGNIGTSSAFRVQQDMLRSRMVSAGTFDTSGGTGGSGGTSGNGSSGQNGEDDDKTQFSFDDKKKSTVQSKDEEHAMVVDSENDHAHLSVTIGGKAYLGGDGQKGTYAPVMTAKGPSKNTFARIG